jgi:prevent-host-death family protein
VLRVGIRELRNQVAAVVRRAAAGERIVVTVDGVPAAMLGPLEPATAGDLTLDDLVAAGLVLPPGRAERDRPPPPPEPAAMPVDVRTARALADVRGD